MICYSHPDREAAGICAVCQKAVCRDCIAIDRPRLVCNECQRRGVLFGFEYRSKAEIAGWPVIHVCTGMDPATMRPRVAKGIIAIGNIAIGAFAAGGVSLGLLTLGGLSLGLLLAVGGAAAGIGWSVGGFAVGSVAVGGMAIGFQYALGGVAIAPHAISEFVCDPEAARFFGTFAKSLPVPPSCAK